VGDAAGPGGTSAGTSTGPGTGTGTGSSARPGLLLLALSVFAVVTTETLPVGLLPPMARSFGVGEATIGLLVTLYAALVAILAVPLTLATRRVRRKRLLLIATGCFALSNVVAGIAPDLAVLAAARALAGAAHAVFFSVCIGYATRLVPPESTGRALALVSAGISAAFVLGVPLATALGTAVGWRGAFVALAALMAVALALIAIRLPPVTASLSEERGVPARRRFLVAAVASNGLFYAGHFTLYTYITLLLLGAGAAPAAVGPILLGFGALGLLGVWITGPRLDRHFRRTALTVLAVVIAAVLAAGGSFPVLAAVLAAGALWTGAFGPVASIYQTAAVRTEAVTADLGGAWVNATANFGIGAGAAIGGAVLEVGGIRAVAWTAAAIVVLAAVVVMIARGTFPSRTGDPKPSFRTS
jgi:predicted MFS family arabinose efflux permease